MKQIKLNPSFYISQTENSYNLFNSNNNLIYEIDELYYEVLKRLDGDNQQAVVEELKKEYSEQKILETIEEINLQIKTGVLKDKGQYIEEECYLEFKVTELINNQEFIQNLILQQFDFTYYLHFSFLEFTEIEQLEVILDFIKKIKQYFRTTSRVLSFALPIKPALYSNNLRKQARKNNLKLVCTIEETADIDDLLGITDKSGLILAIRSIDINLKRILDEFSGALLSEEIHLYVDFEKILAEMHGELITNYQILKTKLKKIQEYFIELTKVQGEIVNIYPFSENIKLLDSQQSKQHPCYAGQRKFYLQNKGIFPCRKLCREKNKLNYDDSVSFNQKRRSEYYQEVTVRNDTCSSCFAKGMCGGLCYKYRDKSPKQREEYCKLQKLLARLSIEAYQRIESAK